MEALNYFLNNRVNESFESMHVFNGAKTAVLGIGFIINSTETRVIYFECESDGESLRLKSALPWEGSMGEYGSVKTERLDDRFSGAINKCKCYFVNTKLLSIELSFQNRGFLSITNWGDDLILKEEPFAFGDELNFYDMVSIKEL